VLNYREFARLFIGIPSDVYGGTCADNGAREVAAFSVSRPRAVERVESCGFRRSRQGRTRSRWRRSSSARETARSPSRIIRKLIMKLHAAPMPGGQGDKSGERYLAEWCAEFPRAENRRGRMERCAAVINRGSKREKAWGLWKGLAEWPNLQGERDSTDGSGNDELWATWCISGDTLACCWQRNRSLSISGL